MLEVTRLAAQHRGKLRRSLRTAFWSGHSHGRYCGSQWYADHLWDDLHKNCVVNINVDCTGRLNGSIVTESAVMAETKAAAASVVKEVTGKELEGERIQRVGDQSFWGLGIPSMFISVCKVPGGGGLSELTGSAKKGGSGWWYHTSADTLDKVDPDNLVRDTQIYLLGCLRFCGDRILPLDHREAVKEILEVLWSYHTTAGGKLDLSPAIDRCSHLLELLNLLYSRVDSSCLSEEQVDCINDCFLRVSRSLVPLNYTTGSMFEPDPALDCPPVPLLQPAAMLRDVRPNSSREKALLVGLVRRRNAVCFALDRAIADVQAGLNCIGG
jgi:hypothetical protein